MPAFGRSLDALTMLSDQLQEAIRRRLRECAGLGLIALALGGALMLATWSVKDPSFSHATSAHARNLLGVPGAVVADLLMQLTGVAAVAVFLPLAMWGWRLIGHKPIGREALRAAAWLFAILLAAAFASCLPRTAAWPLPTGLGGVIGDALLRLPAALVGKLSGWPLLIVALLTGTAAAFLLAIG